MCVAGHQVRARVLHSQNDDFMTGTNTGKEKIATVGLTFNPEPEPEPSELFVTVFRVI